MAERFIFNPRLNRPRTSPWYWICLLVVITLTFDSWASERVETFDLSGKNDRVNQLTNIDFRHDGELDGRVILSFDNDKITPRYEVEDNTLVVWLDGVGMGDAMLYQLDVRDFATRVNQIETFRTDEGSRIEVVSHSPFDYREQRSGNHLVLEIIGNAAQAQAEAAEQYEGKAISLDFQDVPVRQVLQVIAQVNGFNLVTTDSVTGNVTINLNQVPWDQALKMIMKIKGLDMRQEGSIWLIAPADELAARETQELQTKQQVAELAPLHSVNIQINYAKASELATILKSSEGGLLSSRGSVTVDERTNTLLVRDTLDAIAQARSMVEALDVPVKQVLIESRMVTVLDNVDEQFGVRFGFSNLDGDVGTSGSLAGADTMASGQVPDLADRLNVNLPVSQAAGRLGIQVARLIDGTILDLELSALEQENKGEIIASPRITVANQHEAYIEQGTEIPYVQSTSSGATSVEFKKAVLSLKVTPHITPDNRIILDLVVTQDTRGETVSTSTGPAVAIDTQEISTQVLVDNGETIVLGGIFQQSKSDSVRQVPLLGDLPVLGNLFKSKGKLDEKRELLIFVTPKILNDGF